jgi:hypothetical protein
MEAPMAKPQKTFNPDQPEMPEEIRRRDQPVPDATVPRLDEGVTPGAPRPSEDGGVDQHPVHDSDTEDLGPEDFEHMTDEVAKTGIKGDR